MTYTFIQKKAGDGWWVWLRSMDEYCTACRSIVRLPKKMKDLHLMTFMGLFDKYDMVLMNSSGGMYGIDNKDEEHHAIKTGDSFPKE